MVIDAVLDKTIDKIRVKIRYPSGRECYVMDRLLADPSDHRPHARLGASGQMCIKHAYTNPHDE